jgi:hypothetical protein
MVVGSDDTKQKGVSSWKGSNHVTEFITAVLYCDYKIGSFIHKALKLRLPGLSNYIVCKKRPA